MAVSHKDWEQPNSPISLAKINIESGLLYMFPSRLASGPVMVCDEKFANFKAKTLSFSPNSFYLWQ